jgi:DNA invertase Pin-like site-specific DNA recombinase
MPTTAYSYIRYSSRRQGDGDSTPRQKKLRNDYLARHPDLVLDDGLKPDKGVSAFRGKNTRDGSVLASFLSDIKTGRVRPGSVLIVESLDRLSRDKPRKTMSLLDQILDAGITIVTLQPEREYSPETIDNTPFGLFEPMVPASRANEESETKSKRIHEKWNSKRQAIQDGARIVPKGNMIPAWLRFNGSKDKPGFVVNQTAALTVKKIFELAASGYGHVGICKKLNESGVKPIGRSGRWNYAYVKLLLGNRAVLGEHQSFRMDGPGSSRRIKTGQPIKNYYPRIISDALFNKVRVATKGRASTRGRVGHDVANLFTGLLIDARDGKAFWIRNTSPSGTDYESRKERRTRYLINSAAVSGEGSGDGQPPCRLTFPYHVFEEMFLLAVKELKIDEFEPDYGGVAEAELAALLDRQAENAAAIAAARRRVTNPEKGINYDTLVDLLVELERERDNLQARIDQQKLNATGHSARVLKDTQLLVERLEAASGNERTDLRERIRGRIRALVDRAYLLVWKREKVKHLLAQIHFCNRSVRVLYLNEDWDGRALLNPLIAPERDLRNFREHPWELGEVAAPLTPPTPRKRTRRTNGNVRPAGE